MPNDGPGPTPLEQYLFDLRGFIVIEGALSDDTVTALNTAVDDVLPLASDQWDGFVHRKANPDAVGDSIQLQQIYELSPFDTLIDHPAWFDHVTHFVGNQDDFDTNHGPVYIDENFMQITPADEGTEIHSGGHTRTKRTQYRWHNDSFHCGQVNVLVALNDIGPGDGATMAVPGSHKQNIEPPFLDTAYGKTLENVPEAREIHLEAGDALVFVDCLMHGSATRQHPGSRRFFVYRYGPSWGVSRRGYEPSDQLLDRLSPEQATIIKTWGSVTRKRPPSVE